MRFASRLVPLALASMLLTACPGTVQPDTGTDAPYDAAPSDTRIDAIGGDTIVPDGNVPDHTTIGPFGATCTRDADCESGICLSIGRCSRTCTSGADCPASTNWNCVGLPGRGTVCDCTVASASDLPCNNIDDDCNGQIDDTSRTCAGACVDVSSDTHNCGACGIICGGGTICRAGRCDCPTDRPTVCGTQCVATDTDAANCGSCGHACTGGPNATPICTAGVCGITCAAGSANCDGNPANGCETNTRTDLSNCGMCGHPCTFANATGTCSTGACVLSSCTAGYQNCDGDPSNGCETGTGTDTMNCGACGNRCMPPNGVGACTAGVCDLAACNPGFANCNTIATDGCEAALATDRNNCGSCGHVCPAGGPHQNSACASGACTIACAGGYADCNGLPPDGCETSLQFDPANCGACGVVCPSGMVCSAGTCGVACGGMPGFTLCGTRCVNLSNDANNCGACGVPCAAPSTCSGGICACASGLSSCGGSCVNLTSDPTHCGSCTTTCPTVANAAATCTASTCGVACNSGYGDCDGVRTNGCETNTDTSTTSCGTCGHACPTGTACVAGSCSLLLGGLGGAAGYGTNRLDPSDDGTSCAAGMAVDLTTVAATGLNFYGTSYRQLCVNNNGNVNLSTAAMGINTYTPSPLPFSTVPLIAPWFGDVDTRGGSLTIPTSDAVYWDVRAGQFVATWLNVGYFSTHDDLQNTFQLIIRSRSDVAVGDFDIEFRYQRCQWTTGDASGGTGGLGGTPALAGIDAGNHVDSVTLPGSSTASVLMLCTTSNISQPGVWRYSVRSGRLVP